MTSVTFMKNWEIWEFASHLDVSCLAPGEILTTETDGSQYVTGLPEVGVDE